MTIYGKVEQHITNHIQHQTYEENATNGSSSEQYRGSGIIHHFDSHIFRNAIEPNGRIVMNQVNAKRGGCDEVHHSAIEVGAHHQHKYAKTDHHRWQLPMIEDEYLRLSHLSSACE